MDFQKRDDFYLAGKKFIILKVEFAESRVTYSPLHLLLKKNNMFDYFRINRLFPNHDTLRGYICKWELIDNVLFLISFQSSSTVVTKVAQLFSTDYIEMFDHIRSGDSEKYAANWFTGITYIVPDNPDKYPYQKGAEGIKCIFENGNLIGKVAFVL